MISLLLAVSPWLAFVYDYCPAPGQFINEVPEIAAGTTREEVLDIVREQLTGAKMPGTVSLGAYGGYVTVGFDHPVVNVEGEPDFKIYGNAIPNGAEPGIIMVSQDINGNGLPDDPWYELKGSLEDDPETKFDYTITYHAPVSGKEPVKDENWKFITDAEYIRWEDSLGDTGYIMQLSSHLQNYWPEWETAAELTFTGTLLPSLGECSNTSGTSWTIKTPEWGYVDSQPNASEVGFDIGNAVNSERQPVYLPQIDFIRIYTAENQYRGWLGETSTEVAGGEDLHPDAEPSGIDTMTKEWSRIEIHGNHLYIYSDKESYYSVCDMSGRTILEGKVAVGTNNIELNLPEHGIYLVKCGKVVKFAL